MSEPATVCPICGHPAEAGCVYSPDEGRGLRWRPGEHSFVGNIVTGLGGGELVGQVGWLAGPYAKGIRCDRCQKLVLELGLAATPPVAEKKP